MWIRDRDEAGLEDCGIVLSNDLDEHTIQSICDEGAQVASWGVGTTLACAYDQPPLGGVYKLSATRAAGEKAWRDCLKISESAAKLTVPGVLDVRRYYHEDGRIAGDMVYDVNAGVHPCETIIDPCDDLRQKQLAGKRHEALLHPLARAGKTVLAPEGRDALAAQARAKEGLATLDESQKRMLNPHSVSYTHLAPELHRAGIVATVGKGRRSEAVRQACIDTESVYFAAVGGAAAFLAKCVESSHTISYDDLGTEALRRIDVVQFPVFVGIDVRGRDVYGA